MHPHPGTTGVLLLPRPLTHTWGHRRNGLNLMKHQMRRVLPSSGRVPYIWKMNISFSACILPAPAHLVYATCIHLSPCQILYNTIHTTHLNPW